MTTEQFEKIALFMGWRECDPGLIAPFWRDGKDIDRGIIKSKTSLTNDEACELLGALAEKGYGYSLHNSQKIHRLVITTNSICVSSDWHPTIPEAVAAATLALLEKEGR